MKEEIKAQPKKLLFIGGHATPAFAVIDEILQNHRSSFEITWVGERFNQKDTRAESAEFKTVTEKYALPFIEFKSGKLIRHWDLKSFFYGISQSWKLIRGFFSAFKILRASKPDVIVSFGGFLAVPIVLAAKLLRKRVVTHEQTIVTGLANKIIAKYADVVLVSWEESKKYFPEDKVIFTGNPIRKDIFEIKSNITDILDRELPILYITGGNQGAHEINKRVFEILEDLLETTNVIHQTGSSTATNDYQKALEMRQNLPVELQHRYIVRDYIYSDEIGEVQNKSDLWLSRSGANTITELLVLQKPAILLPIPWTSQDEQTKNAKKLEEVGLALRLIQSNALTPQLLLEHITDSLTLVQEGVAFDGNKLTTVRRKIKDMAPTDAAEKILELL